MSTPITPDERAAMRARYPAGPIHESDLLAMGMRALDDVPRLLGALDAAEVEVALRAEVRLAKASAHSASLALGAQLAARPAPAWDEEAVVEGMVRAVYPLLFTDDRQPLHAELREGERDVARERMRQALAVVREHLPVKPHRDALAAAIRLRHREMGSSVETVTVDDYESADAALSLLPGRTESEIKAEALREARDAVRASSFWADGSDNYADRVRGYLSARADRLAAEGGADRG